MGILTILWEKWVEFRRDFYKITLAGMIAPLMYLIVFGMGIQTSSHGEPYLNFLIPGVVSLTTMNGSFNAIAQNLNVRQTEALCKKLAKPAKPPKVKDNFTRPKRAIEVEAALKEVTGSEVHVDYKDGKGSLKIDFYSDDMLQKFVSLLGMYDPEG